MSYPWCVGGPREAWFFQRGAQTAPGAIRADAAPIFQTSSGKGVIGATVAIVVGFAVAVPRRGRRGGRGIAWAGLHRRFSDGAAVANGVW